ncbi:MAG TPA: O-antigen ligase family protein [Longimicrobiales bacterium]|nr:O-antigen ligase family protein [Longimicrobiales bacterium]
MNPPGVIVSSVACGAAAFLLYTNLLVVVAQQGIVPTAAAAIVPGLLFLAVIHRLVVRREPLIVDRTLLLMLVFLAVFLVSTFTVPGYAEAISRIVVYVTEGICIYFLVRNAVRDLPSLRVSAAAVVAAAALLAALSLVQTGTGNLDQDFLGLAQRRIEHLEQGGQQLAGPQEMGLEDRAFGPVGDPNRFAQILMMALPLAFVGWLDGRRWHARMLSCLCLLSILGGIVITYSRGGFLTLVVLMLMAAPLGLLRGRTVVALFAAGIVLTPVLLPGYANRVLSISGVAELLGSTQVEADGPTEGRTTEMLAALAAFTDHAVLGVGPGQYVSFYSVKYQALPDISIREIAEPRRAHNLYLELGAETGTLGLVTFMVIPLLLLRDLRAIRLNLRRRNPALARLCAAYTLVIFAYLGTGVFLHLAFERYYWFMVGLAAAAAGTLEKRVQEGRAATPVPATPGAWTGTATVV